MGAGEKKRFVYVLRTVDKERKAHGGFQWPEKGFVEAPDWDPKPECGHGLHGWLRGEGDSSVSDISDKRLWQVVRVEKSTIVELGGKVKFPRGEVVLTGTCAEATALIQKKHPNAAVIRGTATAGNDGTATAGNDGTATAGNDGTATAGNDGIIVLRYWDSNRYRLVVGYPGEDGIEAGKKYRLNGDHRFEEVH